MRELRTLVLTAVVVTSVAALAAAATASAKGSPGIRVSGVCSQVSTSKLKLSREDSGVQVEFEVDQNRSGIPWKVTLRRNGAALMSTTATTHGPSGSFSLHRTISGAGGTFSAVATRAGERCSAQARI